MRTSLLRPLRTGQLVFDIFAAALFVPVFAFSFLEPLPTTNYGQDIVPWLGIAVTLVFAGALAIRRLSPALSLGIAWAGAIAQMAVLIGPQPVDVAVFGVLYATAAYGTRLVMWLGLASAVAGAAVAAVYTVLMTQYASPAEPFSYEWILRGGSWFAMIVFALLLSWTTGALVRASRQARANREARDRAEFETASEQERGRIARDMHDVVAHSLAVVVAQADGARYAADADPDVAKQALGTISQTARSALSDVRLLLAQLRHRQGDGPQPTLADLEGLFAQVRSAGVELSVDVDPTPPGEPPAAVQLAVFRILQEALTNALRHGDGRDVDLRMAWAVDAVAIEVRNAVEVGAHRPHSEHGISAESGAPVPSRGHGIVGMAERAQLVGGSLTAAPDGRMFVVRAQIPVSGYAAAHPTNQENHR
ncbi:sensor histidine kinase [Microbacterium halotolerans]|uniref:sensor histidine kinase n=1 Tax=Microbacterium halotolerans TaxID=246613 RepID=UPI000E6ACC0F|nr:histidine kinase [Microbacterium halotolerans]